MSSDSATVFIILTVTVLLFLSEKLALDLVGVLALLALYFAGILSPEEALSGFSNPVVITLAALFIIGGSLFRTGVAASIGEWLQKRGSGSQTSLVVTIMSLAAVLSAFMSSTGTAAILIPAISGLAKKTAKDASKLLMPLAYGCLIGGMLTLVGTPPNLVVQEALIESGREPFGFFSFAPMGLLVLGLGVLYMVALGTRILPGGKVASESPTSEPTMDELAAEYGLRGHLFRVRLVEHSRLNGLLLRDARLREKYGLNLVGVQTEGELARLRTPGPDFRFAEGHIVHLQGSPQQVEQYQAEAKVEPLEGVANYSEIAAAGGLAEVLIHPRSRLIQKTLPATHFQQRFGVNVLGWRRLGKTVSNTLTERLKFGDSLLVAGTDQALEALWAERGNFVVTGMPEVDQKANFRREKAWLAICLALLMLFLLTFKLLPSVIAVLLVAACAVLVGCLSAEEAYHSISWQSLILIAAMLPMAQALEKTGGVDLLAQSLTTYLGQFGPRAILAGLFLLTSVFSQFISNTATTVILTPIAMEAAARSGVAPHAFLMAVAVAASSAFVTPVASPVNMLVLTPGRYRFIDFVKVGLPLQLVVLVVSIIVLPFVFPLVRI